MAEAAAGTQPPLNDLMMAMDVVDTLRHGEALVERELSGEMRRARMIERLREIYSSQGIAVSDRILEEGVDALEQERFVYKPRRGGFAFTLARLYTNRGRISRIAGVAAAAIILVGGVWYVLAQQAENQRLREAEQQQIAAEQLTVELTQTIPADLARISAAIANEANDPAVAAAAAVTAEDGTEAAAIGNAVEARAAVASLEATLAELRLTFDVVVVSRPGEQSGVFRIPNANEAARNYYLIVEALGPGGEPLPRRITSEEDGQTRTVTIWGVRVPQAVYNAVAADKADDGIVQDDVLGAKIRGDVDITWAVDTLGGAIVDW
jgi:hypothetical protein